ncbi:serine/threonine protein phosphatase [Leptolyngbya sp. 15MV]|nr:serine/threonine protein phosphatase [Leptolyngbya sp. 15MV]
MPEGERAYVVGDIHGRLDLFAALADAIEHDDAETPPTGETTVVLLGDLIDRGPHSAQVVALARDWQARRRVRILAGNHEEMFLQSFDDSSVLRQFLRHGGRETILSYGLDEATYNHASLEELQDLMHGVVPDEDRAFLASFEEYVEMGDYLFVHAGIEPQIPLEEQQRHDMIWIRERFLRYRHPHSHVVVHGHTIFDEVDEQHNRIGIDTGAFKTGRLTALVLEGTERRLIQAVEEHGTISIHKRDAFQ